MVKKISVPINQNVRLQNYTNFLAFLNTCCSSEVIAGRGVWNDS